MLIIIESESLPSSEDSFISTQYTLLNIFIIIIIEFESLLGSWDSCILNANFQDRQAGAPSGRLAQHSLPTLALKYGCLKIAL